MLDIRCQLIGSNALNTPATPDTYTLYVKPSEQISVKKGDLIGIYMKGNSFGVGWNPYVHLCSLHVF